jgi:uncharacterized FlaG/YvyC family protein
MSAGFDIRVVQSVPAAPASVNLGPERQVTRTELPEEKVVLPSAETQRRSLDQNDPSRKFRAELNVKLDDLQAQPIKKTSFDDATKELVFRTVSAETGKVVSQFPDEAYLRQRAYADRIEKAEFIEQSAAKTAEITHVEKVA